VDDTESRSVRSCRASSMLGRAVASLTASTRRSAPAPVPDRRCSLSPTTRMTQRGSRPTATQRMATVRRPWPSAAVQWWLAGDLSDRAAQTVTGALPVVESPPRRPGPTGTSRDGDATAAPPRSWALPRPVLRRSRPQDLVEQISQLGCRLEAELGVEQLAVTLELVYGLGLVAFSEVETDERAMRALAERFGPHRRER